MTLSFTLLPKTGHFTEIFMAFFAAIMTKLLVHEACDEVVSRTTEYSNTG